MASPFPSPSRRALRRVDSPIFDKENARESPIHHFGGQRGRIPGLNSSPTPGPLDSFDTFDSPTKDEISRTFGTHFAKVLGKRVPLSPVQKALNHSPTQTQTPQRYQRRHKAKPLVPSAPSSPVPAKNSGVNSPRRAAGVAKIQQQVAVEEAEVAPAALEETKTGERSLMDQSVADNDAMDQSNASVVVPMDISLAPSDARLNDENTTYDEYGFLTEVRIKPSLLLPGEGSESLLRDEPAEEVSAPKSTSNAAEETVQWWEKWLSEGVAREAETAFNSTLHPLRDAAGSPRHAVKDPWRPVATGMVMQYGIPHRLRRQVWPALAKVEALQRKVLQSCALAETPTSYYRTLLKSNNFEHQTWSRIIRLDLDRTFATHRLFRDRGGVGQTHLSNVLTAYAHHNPAIGYCQGMSFVCATMLMITECDEVESFWLLCALMDAPEYAMCNYYSPGMQGLLADSAHMSNMLRMALPPVHQHLTGKCHIDVVYFTARWWLSMFTDLGSWSTTLRIWDLFFAEGRSALQRFSIALLSLCKHDILSQDTLDGVLPYILNIPASKLESSLLFQTVDEIDLAQLDLKYQYWQKEELSKSQKKMQLEKLRKEKLSKTAAAPSTPGAVARSLFTRIWEKISTPSSAAAAEAGYKYTQLATQSPPRSPKAAVPLQASVASTGRAKRKRADASMLDDEDDAIEALDLSDAKRASGFVNLDAIPGRRLDFAQADEALSPSKRRKLTESAPISRRAESSVTVQQSERDSFIAFATPTKRRNI
eukprot:TRINITY_DN299_c0_g1_i1.p1 TRINITY_DN299_c0_g1~~TRINITY_DN299_c0_g1_i1.p1  ORF type:complete len:765 (-),score=124.27 TRINITY_DN299_c0_g1_i1:643-2937(-)